MTFNRAFAIIFQLSLLFVKIDCHVEDDLLLEDSEYDASEHQTSLQDATNDQFESGDEIKEDIHKNKEKYVEENQSKNYNNDLSTFTDDILKESTILCISIYSKSHNLKNDIQLRAAEKLNNPDYDDKLKAMIVEKFIVGGVTSCAVKCANTDRSQRQDALRQLYQAEHSSKSMEEMLEFNYEVQENKNIEFTANEVIVAEHQKHFQQEMAKINSEGKQNSNPNTQKQAKKDELDFNSPEMKQAWAFLGLIVLILTQLIILICICCVIERPAKVEQYTKEQNEILENEKSKLDDQKQKVDELTKTLEELNEEYEEMKKSKENEEK